MKRLLAIILAVSLLPLSLMAKDDKTHEGIHAVSFNIRYAGAEDGTNSWKYRYPAVAMMLDDQRPDIVGLQECMYEQFQYLQSALDKLYKIVGVGRDDGKKAGEMMAIMYNPKTVALLKWGTFWLSETPDVPSKGWDAACYRTATWALMKDKASGKQFYFVNTHLDHQGAEAQKNGAQLVVDRIAEMNKSNLPVILTGDFNLEPGNASLAPLKASLNDARSTAVVSDDLKSYNGWGKESKTLDYVWYKEFTCTKFETITKPYYDRNFISDHYPVQACLIF